MDILFTLGACAFLLGLWALSAFILPWSDRDQVAALQAFKGLLRHVRPSERSRSSRGGNGVQCDETSEELTPCPTSRRAPSAS